MSTITQTTVVLSSFGDGSLERRTRTTAAGKSSDRYTVTIDAKPLILDFDPKTLGRGVAATITAHLQRRVSEIGALASAGTQLNRKYAQDALAKGKAWAVKRYAGGRIGAMTPNQSPRLFNDSGRFVKGITVGPTKDNNWVINVAANRLNATQLGSETALKSIVTMLRSHVPEFGSANELAKIPQVQHAISNAAAALKVKQNEQRFHKLREFTNELTKIALETLADTGAEE